VIVGASVGAVLLASEWRAEEVTSPYGGHVQMLWGFKRKDQLATSNVVSVEAICLVMCERRCFLPGEHLCEKKGSGGRGSTWGRIVTEEGLS
jgi:hypothetical protein